MALVDICASLSEPDGITRRSVFKAWYLEHVAPRAGLLSADDAYLLRCGMLHQGRAHSDQYEAIVFTFPGPFTMHGNVSDGALNLDIGIFCRTITDVASHWWTANQDVEPVRSNAEHLIRYRAEGLAPYFVGMPVLA